MNRENTNSQMLFLVVAMPIEFYLPPEYTFTLVPSTQKPSPKPTGLRRDTKSQIKLIINSTGKDTGMAHNFSITAALCNVAQYPFLMPHFFFDVMCHFFAQPLPCSPGSLAPTAINKGSVCFYMVIVQKRDIFITRNFVPAVPQ
ncbi:MAG: hypothetical protein R3E61_11405 [Pseudomonadales bacterium]